MVRFDTDLGRLLTPDELAALPPEEPMAVVDRKEAMMAAVNARKAAIESGVAPTSAGPCDCDTDSRNKLNGAVLMAMLATQNGEPFAITWTMADNVNVDLDGAGLIAMVKDVGAHIAAVHANSRALKDAIEAASDHAALDAIDLEQGWPNG